MIGTRHAIIERMNGVSQGPSADAIADHASHRRRQEDQSNETRASQGASSRASGASSKERGRRHGVSKSCWRRSGTQIHRQTEGPFRSHKGRGEGLGCPQKEAKEAQQDAVGNGSESYHAGGRSGKKALRWLPSDREGMLSRRHPATMCCKCPTEACSTMTPREGPRVGKWLADALAEGAGRSSKGNRGRTAADAAHGRGGGRRTSSEDDGGGERKAAAYGEVR